MRKSFLKLTSTDDFRTILADFGGRTGTETISTAEALGRITAADVTSPIDLPDFVRSTVDGFAVISKDTHGASGSIPCYLDLVGDIPIGALPEGAAASISSGEAARVVTGGAVPKGADGVVMVEYTDTIDNSTLEVRRGITNLENIVLPGEDMKAGDVVVKEGAPLRPFDIGALTGVGITKIEVFRRPKVSIFSTGGEVVEPSETPRPGQIRDVNKYALSAGISEAGGVPLVMENVEDDPTALKEALKNGIETSDMVVLSGGSSVGNMDFTLGAIAEMAELYKSGSPGVVVHGISIKPGKPTIYGIVDDVPIFGLPGHPVGALIVFLLFTAPMIRMIGGVKESWSEEGGPFQVEAVIDRSVSGAPGRDYYIPVRLSRSGDGDIPTATPLLGKSGMISILTGSAGLLCIPNMNEGVTAGEKVKVSLFKNP
jgi:molybdopterin molybdotransferase